ncbi:MAG: ABC transporter ATP-binding protein [Acidobacteriota bacterium]
MAETAISIKNLKKFFKGHLSIGKIEALRGVDLDVPITGIYGFIGPNGAGKTTTLKIITGLIFPDEGEVKIFGKSNLDYDVRRDIGFLPESPYFYDYLTGEELVLFFGSLFNIPKKELKERTLHLLELVGLKGKEKLPLRKYSKGMLQRVGLAQALVSDPKLLILDEPMSGLDPIGRREIRDLILKLKDEGKTIFFSSHILADAEMICDEVAIIVKGKIVQRGRLENLLGKEVRFWDVSFRGAQIPPQLSPKIVVSHEDYTMIRLESEKEVEDALSVLTTNKLKILSVIPHKASLEELFLSSVEESKNGK